MPPRGNEGLDFTPVVTHYLFLSTSLLAAVSIGQALLLAPLTKIFPSLHGL